MKNNVIFVLFSLFLASSCISAQSPFPKISSNEIPGIKVIQEKYYDGNSLWGYIDGGADIYLEYGFKKLLSYDIDLNGIKYKTDIYNMSDDESAFGIFSASSFKCSGYDSLIRFSCITKYQYQFALGSYYVSIINDKGNDESGNDAALIAKLIAGKIGAGIFALPAIYNTVFLSGYIKDVKCYKGILGIQNGIPEWENLFTNITYNSVYVLGIETASGNINICFVNFNNLDGLKNFGMKFKIDNLESISNIKAERSGKTIQLWKLSETTLLFTESKQSNKEADEIIKNIDEFIKVSNKQ